MTCDISDYNNIPGNHEIFLKICISTTNLPRTLKKPNKSSETTHLFSIKEFELVFLPPITMIKNSSDNMQHDNELFDDDVQLESLAASLSPFDNDLNPDLVTMDPSFEATNHDFRDNQAFTIDLLFFRCLRFSYKIQLFLLN